MSAPPRSRWTAWTTVVVLLALVVRLPRIINRWDEVALAYAAYAAPTSEALWQGRVGDAVATWVGLHPPLHALWLALWDGIWPAPGLWMLTSVVCSVGAVALVGRHAGPLAALVLATAPLQLQDAAEVNNYPLAVLGVAALVTLARAPVGGFLVGVALASWGHVLGLAAAGVVTAWRLVRPVHPTERVPVAVGAALLAAPLVAGALRLSGQSSTFAQPELVWGEWWMMVAQATGTEGLSLAVLVVGGLLVRPGAHTVVWLALAVTYGTALVAGAAAPHQRPYLALFGPAAAVAVGTLVTWTTARWGRWGKVAGVVVVVGLCVSRMGAQVAAEWSTMQAIHADQRTERAVDLALAHTRRGDVLWLVAPALQADDDKTDHSAVLARFSPWQPMPRHAVAHAAFSYADWLWGQPRHMNDRVVHTSTELDPARFDVVVARAQASGQQVAVVVYDHGPATGLLDRVRRTVRIYDPKEGVVPRHNGLGDDHLWLIPPLQDAPGARP